MKRVRPFSVVSVDRTAAKGQERRESRIHNVRANKVREHDPAWVAHACGPRTNERPPEQNRRNKETEVLEVMPQFVFQSEVIGCRYVPAKENQIHGQPTDYRRSEE